MYALCCTVYALCMHRVCTVYALFMHTVCTHQLMQLLPLAAAGDADYNDVVDAARIAGHKVHLYHSHSVAHTLQGNVDHHEAWHAFLARKSGDSVEDLEDTGFTPRGMSPVAFKSAGAHLALSLISHDVSAFMPHHGPNYILLSMLTLSMLSIQFVCLLLQMPCV